MVSYVEIMDNESETINYIEVTAEEREFALKIIKLLLGDDVIPLLNSNENYYGEAI
jgi:hypothetical protein